jgi:outer membrane receptor protein involved in Fe transport
MRQFPLVLGAVGMLTGGGAWADDRAQPTILSGVDVIAAGPLSGSWLDRADVPAAINSISADDINRQASQNVVDVLLQRAPSIAINSESGNDFEPDVQFRGFVATPLSGVPEGLAVYQSGVRINDAFGDSVYWDFIPTVAISSLDVLSNNPIFGLNALGGAINMQMKDGFSWQGLESDFQAGSFGRLQNSTQGGWRNGRLSGYAAIETAHDDGWREASASAIRRLYGDVGYRDERLTMHLSITAADNAFGAAATAPVQLIQQNYAAVFTTPQTDHNQLAMVSLRGEAKATQTLTIAGTLYYRGFDQHRVDGNGTDAQACAADAALLCFNGPSPANGANGQQLGNPFGAGALLGEIDRNSTDTAGVGGAVQVTNTARFLGRTNRFSAGASIDAATTRFSASAELGTVAPDFSVTGGGVLLGASGDPISDGPVRLIARNTYIGVYGLDTLDLSPRISVTAGGRFNTAWVGLSDQLNRTGAANGLSGSHDYSHFNPVLGATFKASPGLTVYAGYSQANRAPTPLELGCANPNMPCIIDSFLVSDPNLKQVISRTVETGLRGKLNLTASAAALNWKLGFYRTDNTSDILNIPSPLNNGFGYFANVGATRRQGVEAEVDFRSRRWLVYATYAYVDAVYRKAITLAAPAGDPFADADGDISVARGGHISSIPPQRLKFGADYDVTPKWKVGGDLLAVSSQYYGGDESNQNPQLPGYLTIDLQSSYQATPNLKFYGLVDNLLNQRYSSYATFFDGSRYAGHPPFPHFTDPRTVSPGKPFAVYAGLKVTF